MGYNKEVKEDKPVSPVITAKDVFINRRLALFIQHNPKTNITGHSLCHHIISNNKHDSSQSQSQANINIIPN